MQVSQSVGISLPVSLLKRIDNERGDIPRSRFLLRILQKSHNDDLETHGKKVNNKKSRRDIVDQRTEILQSTISLAP
jgi:hypothetical protein